VNLAVESSKNRQDHVGYKIRRRYLSDRDYQPLNDFLDKIDVGQKLSDH